MNCFDQDLFIKKISPSEEGRDKGFEITIPRIFTFSRGK